MKDKTNYNKLSILKRFAGFFTRTLDRIADHGSDEQIPEFLFDIRYLMTQKLSNKKEHLEFLKSYVEELSTNKKYVLKPSFSNPANNPKSDTYKTEKAYFVVEQIII